MRATLSLLLSGLTSLSYGNPVAMTDVARVCLAETCSRLTSSERLFM